MLPIRTVVGRHRKATSADRDLLTLWFAAFQAEIGETRSDVAATVERRLRAGELWIWDDDGPVAFAALSEPVAEVVRVGPVYTSPEHRNCGYASSLVATMSSTARRGGNRCILYTELDNPTSNSIYRAMGYRARSEVLRYQFLTG